MGLGAALSGLDGWGNRKREDPDGTDEAVSLYGERLDRRSRVSREAHARFWERLGVRVPRAGRLVIGFESGHDAERCFKDLQERFQTFGLEIHPAKTRLVEFGRFAATDRRARGLGKPETFSFLGFVHFCTKTRRGRFRLGRKPIRKRVRRTLKRVKEVLRRRMHDDIWKVGRCWAKS